MVRGSRSNIQKIFENFLKKKNFSENRHMTHQIEALIMLNPMVAKWRRSDVMVVLESSFFNFLKNCVGWPEWVMWPLIIKRRLFYVDRSQNQETRWHERANILTFNIFQNFDFSVWRVIFEGPYLFIPRVSQLQILTTRGGAQGLHFKPFKSFGASWGYMFKAKKLLQTRKTAPPSVQN